MVEDVRMELRQANNETKQERKAIKQKLAKQLRKEGRSKWKAAAIAVQLAQEIAIHAECEVPKNTERLPYEEGHRSATARDQDKKLPQVRGWLENGLVRPEGCETDSKFKSFLKNARKYFIDEKRRLY